MAVRRRRGFQTSELLLTDLHELGRDDVVAGRRLLDARVRTLDLLANLGAFRRRALERTTGSLEKAKIALYREN